VSERFLIHPFWRVWSTEITPVIAIPSICCVTCRSQAATQTHAPITKPILGAANVTFRRNAWKPQPGLLQRKTMNMLVCVSHDWDLGYVPHYVRHYLARGITRFVVVLHSVDGTNDSWNREHWPSNTVFDYWIGPFRSGIKVRRLERARKQIIPCDRYASFDVDEFACCPNVPRAHYPPVTYGRLVDRFAEAAGRLGELTPEGNIFLQFPVVANGWSKKHIGSVLHKPVIFSKGCPFSGIHNSKRISFRAYCARKMKVLRIDHFKWANNRIAKAQHRIEPGVSPSKIRFRNNKRILKKFAE
jgi:hypothetical protein